MTKPKCRLVGEDGNAFAIMGRVTRALKDAGYTKEKIDEYIKDATSGDYSHLLAVSMKWVDDDSGDDEDDEGNDAEVFCGDCDEELDINGNCEFCCDDQDN